MWTALWIVYIIWGSTYLAIRLVVRTMPPLTSAGARFALAGGILWLFMAVRNRAAAKVSRKQAACATLVGVLLCGGGNGVLMIAEKHVPSGLASLLIAAVPLVVIVLRLTVARDRISTLSLISVAVGFVGVALLLLPGGGGAHAPLGGMLLCVFAAVSWGTGTFLSPRLTLPKDPLVNTGVQMLGGGVVLLIIGTVRGEAVHPSQFSTQSLLAFVYLIAIGSWVAFTAYVWLLQNAPVSRVATYAYVNPVVAIALGALTLGEDIEPLMFVGAAIVVGSVAAVIRSETAARTASTARSGSASG